jgi:hypothetical protein
VNKVGDKLQPCLNPLLILQPLVIRFPMFIFELDPLYNDFIASLFIYYLLFIYHLLI